MKDRELRKELIRVGMLEDWGATVYVPFDAQPRNKALPSVYELQRDIEDLAEALGYERNGFRFTKDLSTVAA